MINKEAIPAFDMFPEELEGIFPELNAQGKDLLDKKQYTQSHNLIDKDHALFTFENKERNLRSEWINMNVPPIQMQMELPTMIKPLLNQTTKHKRSTNAKRSKQNAETPSICVFRRSGMRERNFRKDRNQHENRLNEFDRSSLFMPVYKKFLG